MSCLLIEPWDFTKPLYGNGCEALSDSAIRNLGSRLKIVGATSEGDIGRWTQICPYGVKLDFLPVIGTSRIRKPRLLASNVEFAAAVARHSPLLREAGTDAVLTKTYTILWLLAFGRRRWDICFYFPGLANPLLVGKRPLLGRCLAPLYEYINACAINRTNVAFAAASTEVVKRYNETHRRFGLRKEVRYLPTAVNLDLFRPRPMAQCRQAMGLPEGVPIFTFVGRLASVKGIPLLLDALKHVHDWNAGAILLLVGEGEERHRLECSVKEMNLQDRVKFLGRCPPNEVATAIGSANVCVVASFQEGFSNAMVEQIACGRPIVSTAVSGADELVLHGRNGYIVASRNPKAFARRMIDALRLPEAEKISRELAVERYSDKRLWQQMAAEWPALR